MGKVLELVGSNGDLKKYLSTADRVYFGRKVTDKFIKHFFIIEKKKEGSRFY